ncbi:ATP-dependent RNA helicase DbpA [Pseudobacteriovorax antillogorgiicola]|uniref:ATP-dependent RNA helicase DbpA n=1 Tax=Pseudobacteriovorax antillogorgiicola TaxID=1513793 RepID=A0A1Y6CQT7_9BACT|nr:ATP-dependent RNA helicase DbpA [Pseudobacteriovorax antillogorgiicola]TCS42113.1 ATP-dependent RNA helicase DbpA [Pseudobacteriovorax antillogorgiicola]SMF83057.1 ATP-dependent RNA helicase DbpA [Pseudobacteriovorax antillogorgiicola]
MSSQNFSSLDLASDFLDNLKSLGYHTMTPIQSQALPLALAGQDLLAKGKTGSGKTAAFGICLARKLRPSVSRPQSIVLCPTRELADQIATELRRLARRMPNIKVLTLTGGIPIGPQLRSLAHGAHIVVGTPGRIADHLRKRSLDLRNVNTLVLDEADRMLDMGFIESVECIVQQLPTKRQTLLFSATFPDNILELSQKILSNPVRIEAESNNAAPKIKQVFYQCKATEDFYSMLPIISKHAISRAIIFCQTKVQCEDLAKSLKKKGLSAEAIHGDFEQRQRDEILTMFSQESLSFLIATDVAARGIDVSQLPAVINFELSRDPKVHIHRIGRTGRADAEGLAISIVRPRETGRWQAVQEEMKQQLPLQTVPAIASSSTLPKPPMACIRIASGKKQKMRPGDILGALIQGAGVPKDAIGKIKIFPFQSYVAIQRPLVQKAFKGLRSAQIKGRRHGMIILS